MRWKAIATAGTIVFTFALSSVAQAEKRLEEYEIAKEAYIYAFSMIAGCKAQ